LGTETNDFKNIHSQATKHGEENHIINTTKQTEEPDATGPEEEKLGKFK
jgi:hypothetical protein